MYWDALAKELIEKIPELKPFYNRELKEWDEFPGNHNIFGNVLNPFLIKLLEEENHELLKKRIFNFLEAMAQSEDVKIQEVLTVTVLERLGDSKDILIKAKRYMGEKTILFCEEIERWLGRI